MNRSAPLLNLWERALYGLMRLLPVELTSATGGFLVRTNVRWNRPEILAGARRNLKLHHPDLAEVEADRMVWRFLDNIGRFMAEFAVLDKLLPQGRIELAFHEDFLRAAGREPIIIVVLHTGNWEVFSPALQSAGVRNAAFYEPPRSPFRRKVAEDSRRSFECRLLSPDLRGTREAVRLLRQNVCVGIFADEARDGVAMAPLFGRAPHDRGNLAIIARLARSAQARVVTAHCERTASCRFKLVIGRPAPLAQQEGPQNLLGDVAFLNAMVEPIVSANLDSWYFLDDALEGIANRRAGKVVRPSAPMVEISGEAPGGR